MAMNRNAGTRRRMLTSEGRRASSANWKQRLSLCIIGLSSCWFLFGSDSQLQAVSLLQIDQAAQPGQHEQSDVAVQEIQPVSTIPTTTATTTSTTRSAATDTSTQPSQPKQPPCYRQCKHRKNKILYFMIPHRGAGMNDRVYQFQRLMQMAGYLCATLEAARPVLLLSEEHNAGDPIAPTLRWDDFIEHRFLGDDVLALSELNPMHTDKLSEVPRMKDHIRYYSSKNSSSWRIGDKASKTARAKVIVTKKEEQFEQHFLEAEAHSFHNEEQPFAWFIVPNFYVLQDQGKGKDWVQQRRDNPSHPFHAHWRSINPLSFENGQQNCNYLHPKTIPAPMRHVADSMKAEIAQSTTNIARVPIFFHVRRGDTKEQCDTSLPRVERYINCTFSRTEQKPLLVLFDSDERDAQYRETVLDRLRAREHMEAVDADRLIRKHMQLAQQQGILQPQHMINMYAFMVSNVLKWTYCRHVLQLRRDTCRDCDFLAGWMGLA